MIKQITISLILTLLGISIFAQNSSENGKVTTPKGNFHALIIFMGFNEDGPDGNTTWPYNDLPTWVKDGNGIIDDNELFNKNPTNIGSHNNLSKWYSDMSMGNFQVTAEVFPELIRVNKYTGGILNNNANQHQQVISYINANYPNYNWSSFDTRENYPNWGFDNSTVNQDGTPASGDDKIDYVIFIERGGGYGVTSGTGGVASSFITATLTTTHPSGNKVIQHGFTSFPIRPSASKYHGLFIHEFAHNLFNSPHECGANGVVGQRFHTNIGWSMSTGENTFLTTNAWERWFLGWQDPVDLVDITDNGQYVIKDFVTTGDAIRIKLPEGDQYLWIENHQKINNFDRSFLTGDINGTPIILPEKGVYMYVEDISSIKTNPTISATEGSYVNKIKMLHGNGHHDYKLGFGTISSDRFWNPNTYNFSIIAPNSYGEHNDGSLLRFNYDGSEVNNESNISYQPNGNNTPTGVEPNEMQQLFRHGNVFVDGWLGEGLEFVAGDKVGLGHNPAITNIQTYYENTEFITPIYIHNITVEIINIAANGDATIEVKFDDAEINQDTRWTGNLSLRNDPINTVNNPQRVIVKSGNNITIDQSLTPHKETSVILENGTKSHTLPTLLSLESGTETTIEAGSKIRVREGSTLHIKAGATLNIEGDGQLIIENGSYICVEAGATLLLQDALSEIHIEPFASTGINSLLPQLSGCIDLCEIQAMITGNGFINRTYIADAGEDKVLCTATANILLGGTPTGINGVSPYTFNWTPIADLDDATLANPTVINTLSIDATFSVTVQDNTGCTDMDEVTVFINPATPTAPAGILLNVHLENVTSGQADNWSGHQVSNEPAVGTQFLINEILPADIISTSLSSSNPAPQSGCLSVNLPLDNDVAIPTYFTQQGINIPLAADQVYVLDAQIKVDNNSSATSEELEIDLISELNIPNGSGLSRQWGLNRSFSLLPTNIPILLKQDGNRIKNVSQQNLFGELEHSKILVLDLILIMLQLLI